MKLMYRVRLNRGHWGCEPKVDRVEVERTTEASVWIAGYRYARDSEFHSYFDELHEAVHALSTAQAKVVGGLQGRLVIAEANMSGIERLKSKTVDDFVNVANGVSTIEWEVGGL